MVSVGWVDSVDVKEEWWDSPDLPQLERLLKTAHEQCLAYAPTPPEVIPESWKQAQILWTKHLYARDKSGNGGTVGPDGFTVSTFPLVLEARSLLRPKTSPFKGLL
jgi:hypothetical protein